MPLKVSVVFPFVQFQTSGQCAGAAAPSGTFYGRLFTAARLCVRNDDSAGAPLLFLFSCEETARFLFRHPPPSSLHAERQLASPGLESNIC